MQAVLSADCFQTFFHLLRVLWADTLADGSLTAGFYVTPVNRNIGNEAPGQIRLITNYPLSLHGGGVYQWKNGSNGLTSDERQAKRISQRVENTLSGFTFSECVTFENEYKQDYYIVDGDSAVIRTLLSANRPQELSARSTRSRWKNV